MTKLPDGQKAAVLWIRNEWHFEKMRRQNFAGCAQVTAHGKLKDHDQGNFKLAAIREAEEELGMRIATFVEAKIRDLERVGVKPHIHESDKKITYTWTIFLDFAALGLARCEPTGHLELISVEQITQLTQNTGDYKDEAPPPDEFAMWPDEYEVVIKALTFDEEEYAQQVLL